jgi:hypothetical protein
MCDRSRSAYAALIALALTSLGVSPIAQAQDKGSIEINVPSGGSVTIFPLQKPADNKAGTGMGSAHKDKPFAKDMEPGNYMVLIKFSVRRWIRIKAGEKTTLTVPADEIPPLPVDVAPGTADAFLVESINKAAKVCDATGYDFGKSELERMEKATKIELDDLEKLVQAESERTHLPADADELKDMLSTLAGTTQAGASVDEAQKQALEAFDKLVHRRDNTKARLKTIDTELASLLPLAPCPPKTVETPPPKPPEEKPPVKPKEDR